MALVDEDETLERCRTVATALDDAVRVPGTDRRVGIDAIVGVLPVAGDAAAAVASSYIVLEAARLGAPKSTLARMAANVALDLGVGSIPVVGDLFDAAFKANLKNVELLERHLEGQSEIGGNVDEVSADATDGDESESETTIEIESENED